MPDGAEFVGGTTVGALWGWRPRAFHALRSADGLAVPLLGRSGLTCMVKSYLYIKI